MPPCSADTEQEVFNRICIMKTVGVAYDKDAKPFPNAVEKDPHLLDKLLADDVKQYIVYRAIQALHEFINADCCYHIPAKNQEYLEEYRDSLDSVKKFIKNCCMKLSDCPVSIDRFKTKTIYDVYCNWCGAVGLGSHIVLKSDFNKDLCRLGCGMKHETNGYECYSQFTLNEATRTEYGVKPITKPMDFTAIP